MDPYDLAVLCHLTVSQDLYNKVFCISSEMNSVLFIVVFFFIVVYLKRRFQLKGKSSDQELLNTDYYMGVHTVISSLTGSSRT